MASAQDHTRELMRRASRQKRLGKDEERELTLRWQRQGDGRAREKLMEAGLRDVVAIARRYASSNVPLADLVSEGTLGLMTAIDRFDPDRGVRLVTYSSHWIRARISRCILREWKRGRTGMGSMRVLRFFKIKRERSRQMTRLGDEMLSLQETARELQMSVAEVREALDSLEMRDASLDAPYADAQTHGLTMEEKLPACQPGPEEEAARQERLSRARSSIASALEMLDDRERMVATERIIQPDPRTLEELGSRLGVSRERVRQIEVKVRSKISQVVLSDLQPTVQPV